MSAICSNYSYGNLLLILDLPDIWGNEVAVLDCRSDNVDDIVGLGGGGKAGAVEGEHLEDIVLSEEGVLGDEANWAG